MRMERAGSEKSSFEMFKNGPRPVQFFFPPSVGAKDAAVSAYTNVSNRMQSAVSVDVRPVSQTRAQHKKFA